MSLMTMKEMAAIAFVHFGGVTFKSNDPKPKHINVLTKLIQQQPTVLGLAAPRVEATVVTAVAPVPAAASDDESEFEAAVEAALAAP